MSGRASLPIEEFLEAVTAQLDKTQDALRMKAVNRPLTFALKDFAIDLSVFIEMNEQGDILFRPSGPNESGASTVQVGFTTITRPMIEENTVSMEMSKSPSLEEVGLAPRERTRLERLGVRNAAQLRRLEASAGNVTMARLSGVNVDRLRNALQLGPPRLSEISTDDGVSLPDTSQGPVGNEMAPSIPGNGGSPVKAGRGPILNIRPGERRLKLKGENLIDGGLPSVRLNKRKLKISRASDHEITLELPDNIDSHNGNSQLEVELPGGPIETFSVGVERNQADDIEGSQANDPWLPEGDLS